MESLKEYFDSEMSTLTQELEEVVIDKTLDSDMMSVDEPNESCAALKPRNYQLEMAEESLRRNIIVAVSD